MKPNIKIKENPVMVIRNIVKNKNIAISTLNGIAEKYGRGSFISDYLPLGFLIGKFPIRKGMFKLFRSRRLFIGYVNGFNNYLVFRLYGREYLNLACNILDEFKNKLPEYTTSIEIMSELPKEEVFYVDFMV